MFFKSFGPYSTSVQKRKTNFHCLYSWSSLCCYYGMSSISLYHLNFPRRISDISVRWFLLIPVPKQIYEDSAGSASKSKWKLRYKPSVMRSLETVLKKYFRIYWNCKKKRKRTRGTACQIYCRTYFPIAMGITHRAQTLKCFQSEFMCSVASHYYEINKAINVFAKFFDRISKWL